MCEIAISRRLHIQCVVRNVCTIAQVRRLHRSRCRMTVLIAAGEDGRAAVHRAGGGPRDQVPPPHHLRLRQVRAPNPIPTPPILLSRLSPSPLNESFSCPVPTHHRCRSSFDGSLFTGLAEAEIGYRSGSRVLLRSQAGGVLWSSDWSVVRFDAPRFERLRC